MPDCWAKGCKSRNGNSRKNKIQLQWEQFYAKKITFHRIPKNRDMRQKWLERMGLNNREVPEKATFCSLHFEESAFDRSSVNCIRIRPGVIPFENADVGNIESTPKKQKIFDTIDEGNIDFKAMNKKLEVEQETVHDNLYCSSDIPETVPIESTTISISNTHQAIDTISQLSTPRKIKNQGIAVLPHLSENTPRKRMLRNALVNIKKNCNRKIKILQEKYRKSMKRNAKLQNILVSLKKKHLNSLNILSNIGTFHKQLLLRQGRNIGKTKICNQYEPELRAFAFLLQQVLHRLDENNIVFHYLEEHSYYQTALQNYVVHLMRAVASKYI